MFVVIVRMLLKYFNKLCSKFVNENVVYIKYTNDCVT